MNGILASYRIKLISLGSNPQSQTFCYMCGILFISRFTVSSIPSLRSAGCYEGLHGHRDVGSISVNLKCNLNF